MRQRDQRKSGSRGTGRGWSTPAASAHFSLEATSWGAHSRLGSRPAGLWPGVGQAVLLWLWGPCKCGCECVRAFVYAHAGLGRRGRAGEGRAFAVGLDPCPGGCSRSRAVHLTPELEAKGQN